MDPRRLALVRSGTARQHRSVGSGYLIAPRLVLTARHVLMDKDTGALWPETRVWVGHPRDGETVLTGAGLVWAHPQGLDVALLLTHDEVEVPGGVRWGRPVGKAPLRYEGLGFPVASAVDGGRDAEHLRGMLPPLSAGARDLYVLEQDIAPDPLDDDRKPWGGASGAAVFCDEHLVGVVIQDYQSYGNRRLRACPARTFTQDPEFHALLKEYADGPPRLTEIGASLPRARPVTERTAAEQELERLLWPLLGDQGTCSVHTQVLAHQLGYALPAGYAPSVPDLVALLAVHPRALASLSSTVAEAIADEGSRGRLTALLAHARAAGLGTLLSLEESELLLGMLHDICKEHPALLPRAARESLRYSWLPGPLARTQLGVEDLEQVVGDLEAVSDSEQVPDGTPQVPALLRLAEYVAAAVGLEQRAELHRWSDRVATRIGIHPTALAERRFDAQRWAAQQPSAVSRILLELTPAQEASEERYFFRILLVRSDGSQTPLHEAESTPKQPEEVARRLRDAVETAATEPGLTHHAPRVTVLVDRKGLHLPVDEWNPGAPNDFVPDQPIGAEFSITLSCPEMSALVKSREREHRRRQESGHQAPLVVDESCGTRQRVRRLLETSHRNATQVVLHGPREQRTRLLELCLAYGVPVVLWDREAACYEDAAGLHPLDPTGPLADLPERVRVFRGEVFDCPETTPVRPALVWEEGGRHPEPESLQLRDPRKGAHAS
ncbi:hypothetical protein [Streptomyces sp. NPDC046197]|uniref:VMAP-C domain-containing protein n=1 Tax=Streptomyces sp. NPDC046197 TaxID=3154337 RepID=UPI0033CA25C9